MFLTVVVCLENSVMLKMEHAVYHTYKPFINDIYLFIYFWLIDDFPCLMVLKITKKEMDVSNYDYENKE